MEEIVRKALLNVSYDGLDITADIAGMVKSFSCTDNASDKADDIELTMEDRDGRWHGSWFPSKGAEIRASLTCENFMFSGQRLTYPCGTFSIDEISATGPPWQITMRGVSSTVMKSLRRESKTSAWENMSLEAIVKEIASTHEMGSIYDAPEVSYKRIDQRKESDLEFISRLTKDAGLKTKVAEGRIIVFEGQRYDAKPPTVTLQPEDLSSWTFKAQAHDIYRACQVEYWDEENKEALTYLFEPPSQRAVGQILKVNHRAESRAAAERIARSRLRAKLEQEITGEIQMMGDPRLFAGNTVSLSGFGIYAGKYFLSTVRHTYDPTSGYRCAAEVRLAIDSLDAKSSEPAPESESGWAESSGFGKSL